MPLHFTIRDLLWLMALIAMGLAWWVDHRQLSRPPAYTLRAANDAFYIRETETGRWFKVPGNNWFAKPDASQ